MAKKRTFSDCIAQNSSYQAVEAPPIAKRVEGFKYIQKGVVRIWKGTYWVCIHNHDMSRCPDKKCHTTRNKTLLKDTHPHLKQEWSPSNKHNFECIGTSSRKMIVWVCKNGHTYESRLDSRTNTKRSHGCALCHQSSRSKIHPDAKRHKLENPPRSQCIRIGDDTEKWFVSKLTMLNCYSHIERIGFTGDQTDIVVTLQDGRRKSLQVKTLTSAVEGKRYYANLQNYPDDMLIVMVDVTRSWFVTAFKKQLNMGVNSFSFQSEGSKHAAFMFTKELKFWAKIQELIPISIDYMMKVSPTCKKELDMIDRLSRECANHNFILARNETNGDSVDVFINNRPVQLKYVSLNNKNSSSYKVGCHKSAGKVHSIRMFRPYSKDDPFEFIIVEVGGTRDATTNYKGHFWVIPKTVLIDRGIIQSDSCAGKLSFCICAPDSTTKHWSQQYWNCLLSLR